MADRAARDAAPPGSPPPPTFAEHSVTGGGSHIAALDDGWKGAPPQFLQVACCGEGVPVPLASEVWTLIRKASHLGAVVLIVDPIASPLAQVWEPLWKLRHPHPHLRGEEGAEMFVVVVDLLTDVWTSLRELFARPEMLKLGFMSIVGVGYIGSDLILGARVVHKSEPRGRSYEILPIGCRLLRSIFQSESGIMPQDAAPAAPPPSKFAEHLVTFGLSSPGLELLLLALATGRVVALDAGRNGRPPQFIQVACREEEGEGDEICAPPRKARHLRGEEGGEVFVLDLLADVRVQVLFALLKMLNLDFICIVGVGYIGGLVLLSAAVGRSYETVPIGGHLLLHAARGRSHTPGPIGGFMFHAPQDAEPAPKMLDLQFTCIVGVDYYYIAIRELQRKPGRINDLLVGATMRRGHKPVPVGGLVLLSVARARRRSYETVTMGGGLLLLRAARGRSHTPGPIGGFLLYSSTMSARNPRRVVVVNLDGGDDMVALFDAIAIKPESERRVLCVGLAEDGEHQSRMVFQLQTSFHALMLPSGFCMGGIEEVPQAQLHKAPNLWFIMNQWIRKAVLVWPNLWDKMKQWLLKTIHVWSQPMEHSWLNVLGPPIKQIGNTCSISASALCIEAQFRKMYKLQFTVQRPQIELLRHCYGTPEMTSDGQISVINVINVINKTGGLTTTTGLILPITGHVPHRLENYDWSRKDVAKFIYKHGPVIASLWVVKDEYIACTGDVVYYGRPQSCRNTDDENQGRHTVVCFGYRFTQSFDLLLRIMDSSSDDGPLRWLHYTSADGLYVPEIGEPLQVNQE